MWAGAWIWHGRGSMSALLTIRVPLQKNRQKRWGTVSLISPTNGRCAHITQSLWLAGCCWRAYEGGVSAVVQATREGPWMRVSGELISGSV